MCFGVCLFNNVCVVVYARWVRVYACLVVYVWLCMRLIMCVVFRCCVIVAVV